jgi:hypothetical protein
MELLIKDKTFTFLSERRGKKMLTLLEERRDVNATKDVG